MKSPGGGKHREHFSNSKSLRVLRRQGKELSNDRTGCCLCNWSQGRVSKRQQQPKRTRGTERTAHPSTAGLDWTMSPCQPATPCHQLHPHLLLKWKLTQTGGKSFVVSQNQFRHPCCVFKFSKSCLYFLGKKNVVKSKCGYL